MPSAPSFALEIDGTQVALAEVRGLALEQDVVEVKENAPDGTIVIRKLPGRTKAGEVTVIRGLTTDDTLRQWVRAVQAGPPEAARKNGTLVVYDAAATPVLRLRMTNAWPSTLEVGALVADPAVLAEQLVIVYDGIELE